MQDGMTETEHLISQAARELQVSGVVIATDGNSHHVEFARKDGTTANIEIKEGADFKTVFAALKAEHKSEVAAARNKARGSDSE